MENEIQNLKNEALAQIMDSQDAGDLERLRVVYLGRQGRVSQLIKKIKDLSAEDRKQIGLLVNETKQVISSALAEQKNSLLQAARVWFDPTIPAILPPIGHLHLVTQAIDEISKIFENIGFARVRYPEVEWDWYAFESLNMPQSHPARDEWETFFVDTKANPKYGQMVLTPHTSSGQVREMQRVRGIPVRMINIAKCHRRQADVSHLTMFHQFEGLLIDEGISASHLKGTLDYFAKNFFEGDRKTRLRPSHFQFTEPSFEVDITCGVCKGRGCKLCKEGWLELGGAGMVHPVVLKNGRYDPAKHTGFAFGFGVERVLMMKSGLKIPDIRLLYSTDLRFLSQF